MTAATRRLDSLVRDHKRTIAVACLTAWLINLGLYLAGIRYGGQNTLQFFLLFGGVWVALMESPPDGAPLVPDGPSGRHAP